MKGTEVLTLGAVGVIHMLKYMYIVLSCYMSSWVGNISSSVGRRSDKGGSSAHA